MDNSTPAWTIRVAEDASDLLRFMRQQSSRRRFPYTIHELNEKVPDRDRSPRRRRGRERISTALAWLLRDGDVSVEGESIDQTKFFYEPKVARKRG